LFVASFTATTVIVAVVDAIVVEGMVTVAVFNATLIGEAFKVIAEAEGDDLYKILTVFAPPLYDQLTVTEAPASRAAGVI
jgi:hypothetical protein